MIRGRVVALVIAAALPVAATAQDGQVSFWLKGDPGNIQGCVAADPQFTREHTFTLKDGQAEITSPGGVNTKLKLVQANVYEADYMLGRMHLHVVANIASTPKSLTVTNRDMGCKWSAVKE
jgi:hypothetical protein